MCKNNARNHEEEKGPSGTGFRMASCCGGGSGQENLPGSMEEMMKACPCSGLLKRHRLAVYTALFGMGLALLILPVGWLLGIVAFFRTI